jgi:hypothetical protein
MIDLQLLSDQIKEELDQGIIDAHKKAESTPRRHLGASIIGHECRAYLWFSFRWARIGSNFDARMLRLFNRGHLEESRFVGWLKQAGWEVRELSEDGKQFRMSAVMGHYGGSLDGMAWHSRYPELGKVLLEFKTKGTGKGFNELSEKGVKLAAGQHYRQMCQYGSAYDLRYGLYQTINKNDDSIHLEVVELDPKLAADDIRRAEDIITSKTRPPRVSESSTYFRCRYCEFSNICHNGDAMDISCRSCSFATPVENSEWKCSKWNNIIPQDFIPKGCSEWTELEH